LQSLIDTKDQANAIEFMLQDMHQHGQKLFHGVFYSTHTPTPSCHVNFVRVRTVTIFIALIATTGVCTGSQSAQGTKGAGSNRPVCSSRAHHEQHLDDDEEEISDFFEMPNAIDSEFRLDFTDEDGN
jgi:hypothetical protein